jgi:hypothetical protein
LEEEVSRCVGEVVFSGNVPAGATAAGHNYVADSSADLSGEADPYRRSEELPYMLPPVATSDVNNTALAGSLEQTSQGEEVLRDSNQNQASGYPSGEEM